MNLTLKQVPKALHQRLKLRAERNRRSLNAEALYILENTFPTVESDIEQLIAAARDRSKLQKRVITTEEVLAALNEGRK